MSKSTSVRNSVFVVQDYRVNKQIIIHRLRSQDAKREIFAATKAPNATEAQEAARA